MHADTLIYAEIVREVSLGLPPDRVYAFADTTGIPAEQAAEMVLSSREHGLPSVIWAQPDDVARWKAQGFETFWGVPITEYPGGDESSRT